MPDANNRLIAGLERARASGVPVMITSPGSSVEKLEIPAICSAMVMDEMSAGAARRRNILAVEREADPGVAPVELVLRDDPGAQGAGGVEALCTRPHRVGALQVAQRHVVHAGEAEHIVHRLVHRHAWRCGP